MGMFDNITVKVPLPGTTFTQFQTKSLNNELDNYEIREDGTLWREDYDTEDRSDPTKTGLSRFAGMFARVNQRWVRDHHTGEIEFHKWSAEEKQSYAYIAFFVNGEMKVGPIRVE